MKNIICTIFGTLGAMMSYLFGGWDDLIIALCVFMVIDYVTGLAVALVFHNSPKTETGKADSKNCIKGLLKKLCMIVLVALCNVLDNVLGTNFVRTGCVVAFMSSEALSIIENAGLMGVPIPKVIKDALDILDEKGEK